MFSVPNSYLSNVSVVTPNSNDEAMNIDTLIFFASVPILSFVRSNNRILLGMRDAQLPIELPQMKKAKNY